MSRPNRGSPTYVGEALDLPLHRRLSLDPRTSSNPSTSSSFTIRTRDERNQRSLRWGKKPYAVLAKKRSGPAQPAHGGEILQMKCSGCKTEDRAAFAYNQLRNTKPICLKCAKLEKKKDELYALGKFAELVELEREERHSLIEAELKGARDAGMTKAQLREMEAELEGGGLGSRAGQTVGPPDGEDDDDGDDFF